MQGTITALFIAIIQYLVVVSLPTITLEFDPFTFLMGNIQMLTILVVMHLVRPIKAMG